MARQQKNTGSTRLVAGKKDPLDVFRLLTSGQTDPTSQSILVPNEEMVALGRVLLTSVACDEHLNELTLRNGADRIRRSLIEIERQVMQRL